MFIDFCGFCIRAFGVCIVWWWHFPTFLTLLLVPAPLSNAHLIMGGIVDCAYYPFALVFTKLTKLFLRKAARVCVLIFWLCELRGSCVMHAAAYLVAQYSRHEQRRMLKVILIFWTCILHISESQCFKSLLDIIKKLCHVDHRNKGQGINFTDFFVDSTGRKEVQSLGLSFLGKRIEENRFTRSN
jgi:hypothetical protein